MPAADRCLDIARRYLPSTPTEATTTTSTGRSDLLRRAGNLGEQIHQHCDECPVCRPEHFTTEPAPLPLCDTGRELHRQYRQARWEWLA